MIGNFYKLSRPSPLPGPGQHPQEWGRGTSGRTVHRGAEPWLLSLHHPLMGRGEAALTETLEEVKNRTALQHSFPSLGSATCRVGASGQDWVVRSGACFYGEVHIVTLLCQPLGTGSGLTHEGGIRKSIRPEIQSCMIPQLYGILIL